MKFISGKPATIEGLTRAVSFCICACILFTACARRPYVAPRAALDYGQFALRQLPPEVDLTALQGKRIVIDPGHGGEFAGAIGPNNLREADVNLGVGLYLWGMLTRAGAEAYLTRVTDTTVYQGDELDLKKDLQARAEFAQTHEADLFISLHHNADVLPGAKKNSLETYFKMSDAGPSLDVARCIHRQLAVSLEQADNVILPGNFHVLRENTATAILGEPSYISHADNAFRLGLAPMQRIEAQAYLLGIAEYFSRGVPEIGDMEPAGTVPNNPRPLLSARVNADRDVPIDPASVAVLVDGEPVEAEFDQRTSQVKYLPPKRLNNGKHNIRISLRNVNGNAATPAENEIEIAMAPAYVLLSSNFRAVRTGSTAPVRLHARVFDADLIPVADGTPVEFTASGGIVSPSVSHTRNGEAVAYLAPEKEMSQEITVSASSSGLTHNLNLKVAEDAPEIIVAKLVDAGSNLPVDNVLGTSNGRPLDYSDASGYFAAARDEIGMDERGNSLIVFSRPGYVSQSIEVFDSTNVRFITLEPIAGGVLFRKKFAIDPKLGGEQKGVTGPTGVRESDVNLTVANYLARFLQASGAGAMLARESDETVSELRRVELAESFGAEWFISIGHGGYHAGRSLETGEAEQELELVQAVVMHYPGSEQGARLAASVAAALRSRWIVEGVTIKPGTEFVLTHTSSPSVIVQGPAPSTAEMEGILRHPSATRKEAYAIYCGILESFGLNDENTGQIALRVIDGEGRAVSGSMLRLDGAFTLETDSAGEFTFARLAPGEHHIEAYAADRRIWAGAISAEAGGIVLVEISLSGTAQVLVPAGI